jgi:hypothetical protein
MAWPYHFLDLSEEEKQLRRELLDRYGVYAQLSALVPILAFQLYRLWIWVYSERQRSKVAYSKVPSSPIAKHAKRSSSGVVMKKWRGLVWWLEGEVGKRWGLRGHWIAAGAWTTWLLFLCVHRTGHGMWSSHFFVVLMPVPAEHWESTLTSFTLFLK